MFEKGKGRKGKTKGRGVLEKAFCRILAPGGDVKGVFFRSPGAFRVRQMFPRAGFSRPSGAFRVRPKFPGAGKKLDRQKARIRHWPISGGRHDLAVKLQV